MSNKFSCGTRRHSRNKTLAHCGPRVRPYFANRQSPLESERLAASVPSIINLQLALCNLFQNWTQRVVFGTRRTPCTLRRKLGRSKRTAPQRGVTTRLHADCSAFSIRPLPWPQPCDAFSPAASLIRMPNAVSHCCPVSEWRHSYGLCDLA